MTFDTIYDQIISTIKATLPDRKELINPYEIEENNELYLKSGVGIELGECSPTETFARSLIQFSRTIYISLTEKVNSTDKKTSVRLTEEKKLIADQLSLITALSGNLSYDVCRLVGDAGIEYIFTEREDYIRLRSSFNIFYNQQVR